MEEKEEEEKVEENEEEDPDPKEHMKKENSRPGIASFGNIIIKPFNAAKAKRHIRGHTRLENIPLKAN